MPDDDNLSVRLNDDQLVWAVAVAMFAAENPGSTFETATPEIRDRFVRLTEVALTAVADYVDGGA